MRADDYLIFSAKAWCEEMDVLIASASGDEPWRTKDRDIAPCRVDAALRRTLEAMKADYLALLNISGEVLAAGQNEGAAVAAAGEREEDYITEQNEGAATAAAVERKEDRTTEDSKEAVNHPPHYGGDTVYEAIKVIEAWGLGFCLGNCVKYISRVGKKDPARTIEDLKKSRWYLDREISTREKVSE